MERNEETYIPWRVINAYYPVVEEREFMPGEHRCYSEKGKWDFIDQHTLEDDLKNTENEFFLESHLTTIPDDDERRKTYESFIEHYRNLIEHKKGDERYSHELMECLDHYASFLMDNHHDERAAEACEEGMIIADKMIAMYEENRCYRHVMMMLEKKAEFIKMQGEIRPTKEGIERGLIIMKQLERMTNGDTISYQHRLTGELLTHYAEAHEGSGELQASIMSKSMSALEQALMNHIDEQSLESYAYAYTTLDDMTSIPYHQRERLRMRGQAFIRHMMTSTTASGLNLLEQYHDEFFDEDDESFE
jgi:hypothetical protein